jgi:hypothetical protein
MDTEKINRALAEAKRFERACRILTDRIKRAPMERVWASKESGSVRRASMDLTRALAELRSR